VIKSKPNNTIDHKEIEEVAEVATEVVKEDTQEVTEPKVNKKKERMVKVLKPNNQPKVLKNTRKIPEIEEEVEMKSQLLRKKNQQVLLLKNSRLNKKPNKAT